MKKVAVCIHGELRHWDITSKIFNLWNKTFDDITFEFYLATWHNHNNKDFILPYKKISLFKRALVRSDIEKIKEGCIYNFGHRGEAEIKDKFYFDDDNGLFLGIYIAEGNSNLSSGTVQITNNDDEILDFVKYWFEKNNIKSIEIKLPYDTTEKYLLDIAADAGINGWELDRLMYNFKNDFISPVY